MKIMSWNVNGIRAATRLGFLEWLHEEKPDILCLQETRAFTHQLDVSLTAPQGYFSFWNPAIKPGYSGVALYTQKKPLSIALKLGLQEADEEGRVLLAEYSDFWVLNCYFPNSQRDHARLAVKLSFCKKIAELCQKLLVQGKNVIICGDFNIAHHPIDLKNPKANEKNAGFLPEERKWMSDFLTLGYLDTFRYFNSEPGHYTWWSNRPQVREKNIGWRIDYFVVNQGFEKRLKRSWHQPQVLGSDHCPVGLELKDVSS